MHRALYCVIPSMAGTFTLDPPNSRRSNYGVLYSVQSSRIMIFIGISIDVLSVWNWLDRDYIMPST